MTIYDRLYSGNYHSLDVYVYDARKGGDYKFKACVAPDCVDLVEDALLIEVDALLGYVEVTIPLPGDGCVVYDDESDSYEYEVGENRYEFYF